MLPEQNGIFQQINLSLKKKWSKECCEILDRIVQSDAQNENGHVVEMGAFYRSPEKAALNKLEEGLQQVKELYNQLYYFISFLTENLPELILKTVETNHISQLVRNELQVQLSNYASPIFSSLNNMDSTMPVPTRREKEVLLLLEKGYCTKEIATKLFISATTVITHKKNLKKKYGVKNTIELISKTRTFY
jgi:DNA-binding CsgD family transcriptional regulator